jgi:hypothetical protein
MDPDPIPFFIDFKDAKKKKNFCARENLGFPEIEIAGRP